MLSMTGFGQASRENDSRRLAVTLRGVNHRYLDLALRLPDLCRRSEAALQRLIGDRVTRGRVELTVEVESVGSAPPRVELRAEMARALVDAVDGLRKAGVVEGDLEASDLLQVPGVVEVRVVEEVWSEADEELLLDAVGAALEEMMGARRTEGRRLAAVMAEKLDDLESLVGELGRLRPEARAALVESFQARLEELLSGAEVDEGRLEQEIAVLIDRSNVSEELERLRAHLEHFGEISEQGGAVGKRLDFVVQEIFRELNTLSAKCRSAAMTRCAVDAKVVCEELREQLRNVE